MTAGRRRGVKSWFVEPYRQVRLGLLILLTNCLFAGLILGVFSYYVMEIYDVVVMYFRLTGGDSAVILAKFRTPVAVGAALIVTFILVTILISVRYTYGIYGPLVSIHRYLDDLLAGQTPTKIQLRDSDQFQDLAEKLNSLSDRLDTGSANSDSNLEEVQKYLDEMIAGRSPIRKPFSENLQISNIINKIEIICRSKPT